MDSDGGPDPMGRLFPGTDIALGVACAAAMAVVLLRWKKKQSAE